MTGVHHTPAPRAAPDLLVAVIGVVAVALVAGLMLFGPDEAGRQARRFATAEQDGFALVDIDPGTGVPARFDPCRPVRYVVNGQGAPDGGIEDLHEAFRRAGAAAGMTFAFAGLTDEEVTADRSPHQPDRYGPEWAPVLVGWVAIDVPASSPRHDVLGWSARSTLENPGRQNVVVSGAIGLARSETRLGRGFRAGRYRGNVMLHEIGHLLGLGHVDTPGEIMAPTVDGAPGDWGPGDRAGLALVGRDGGCVDLPDPRRVRLDRGGG